MVISTPQKSRLPDPNKERLKNFLFTNAIPANRPNAAIIIASMPIDK
jgi:hypothetical protein